MNMEKKRDIAAKCLLGCFIIFYILIEIFAASKQFRYTGYFICFLIALFVRNKFKDKKSD